MKRKIQFVFHTIFHPADGFWDMKREKRGYMPICLVLQSLFFVSSVIKEYAVGFMFDTSLGNKTSIGLLFAVSLAPVLFFAVANLSITTFLEGEGTFKDIYMMVCYCLTPVIVVSIVTTILTNVVSLDEQTYITLINFLGYFWTGVMLFVGIMEVHNYSMSRTFASVILSIIAMAIMAFVLLLVLDMISQIFGFGYSLMQEIRTRT